MTKGRKTWLVVAWLFTLINFGGGAFVLVNEPLDAWHSLTHFVLALAGIVWIGALTRRSAGPIDSRDIETQQRLVQLQQSVDAVALEVERIGEAQRFTAKLAADRAARMPQRDGGSETNR